MHARPTLSILLAVLLGALSPAHLRAQSLFASSKDKDVTIDRAEFGFSGIVQPEVWTPITVWITGGQRAFTGAMIVEFHQDDSQSARIIVPAAATPGVSVPVEATACLPAGLDSVSVTMVDQDGRRKAGAVFTRFPNRRERPLVADMLEEQGLVLCVGRSSAVRAFAAPRFIAYKPTDEGGYVFNPSTKVSAPDLVAVQADSARLPLAWPGYCGAEAVVVDADLSPPPDPRALDALRTWVSGGGRLIVLANSPGNLWRRWLPAGPAGDLVEFQEVARHPTPLDLAGAVHALSRLRREDGYVYAADSARRELDTSPAAPEGHAAESVSGRLMRATATGRQAGWTVRWSPDGTDKAGLLAEGPVGFGWVTILGAEPELAAATPTRDSNAAVWGDAVRLAVSGWLARTTPSLRENDPYGVSWDWQFSSSAPDRSSRQALSTTLDQVSSVPPVGRAVFWGIAGCLALLALLVGPADAILLRRVHLRHISWLTALGWITLASAGAYVVPELIRSGRTALNRVTVIDVLGGQGLAWQTAVTGIFASQRGEMEFQNAPPASWWRGVSSRPWNPWQQVRTTPFQPLTTVQGAGDGLRANVPESVTQGQWTFRMFQDDGLVSTPLNVAVERTGDGFDVRLDGLGTGAVVEGAVLRVSARQFVPLIVPKEGASGQNATLVLHSEGAPRPWDLVALPGLPNMPFNMYSLPGPRLRTDSLESMLDAGDYAAVYLAISGGPPAPGLNVPTDYKQRTIARILVPLPTDAQADPAEPGQGHPP